ncbi:external alternative NAD(P)H-ubiquinone oxidoreductase B4, mitochondrial-like isoform X3 [Chenopodium quinoa]|uniref:external alternative NAD(P)H-ubiquinone oxidoreductase B4, mitochondrial-like isoform X3 n=1 Tax=Chenopodium quinoa TaxID=63459 RepID=UPI000B7727FE|nr:external alternative NAD(P)H-ubiquinone oxidoreductase B4, mitochondrial-like isoform X3 [Chenopodium quinoa]
MKNLPATAQVAAQQGTYLADCFNRMEECEKNPEGPIRIRGEGQHRFKPFRHRHFGQFAPLGAAAQLPGDWVSIGHSTRWLWYSVYARHFQGWKFQAFSESSSSPILSLRNPSAMWVPFFAVLWTPRKT